MKLIDLTGERFGRLVVESRAVSDSKKTKWNCLCDCGERTKVQAYFLTTGHTTSCGCYFKEIQPNANFKHGMTGSVEYGIYRTMLSRCYNPAVQGYPRYGGRGIKVCDRWLEGFENFYADMGPRPSENHSVDREDNDGPYGPSNCKWATLKEQAANKGNRLRLEDGINLLKDVAQERGLAYKKVMSRIYRGATMEEALLPDEVYLTRKLNN